MTTVFLLAAVASALLFWPKGFDPMKIVTGFLGNDSSSDAPSCCGGSRPSFLEATSCLASVRKRLNLTDSLDDEQKEAIDVLQLALTSGSDE